MQQFFKVLPFSMWIAATMLQNAITSFSIPSQAIMKRMVITWVVFEVSIAYDTKETRSVVCYKLFYSTLNHGGMYKKIFSFLANNLTIIIVCSSRVIIMFHDALDYDLIESLRSNLSLSKVMQN